MRYWHDIHSFMRRLALFLKPQYWIHRTQAQREFEHRLKYFFVGCFLGVFLVVAVTYFVPKHKPAHPFMQEAPRAVAEEKTNGVIDEQQKAIEDVLLINKSETKIVPVDLVLKKKETLSGLLHRAGVSMQETLKAAEVLELVMDLRKIRPGQKFELFFDQNSVFQGLRLETPQGEIVSAFKTEDGFFIPSFREGKILEQTLRAEGQIETSFSEAAAALEVPKGIVQQVMNVFDGELSFKDLPAGTTFALIYGKKVTETGREIGNSKLLYVLINTPKKAYHRYHFVDSSGKQGFYDEHGQAGAKMIVKRPLGGARISSGFGMRRHPILKYQIQHAGIDYAAPTGTPIPAGADGVIVQIGRRGAYGRYVRIRHDATYSTAYAHLSAFKKDLRVGSVVKRGDIVGYVGSSGRATGPHLHYEVLKNGKQVNPLQNHVIPKRTLTGQELQNFIKTAQKVTPGYVYVAPQKPKATAKTTSATKKKATSKK